MKAHQQKTNHKSQTALGNALGLLRIREAAALLGVSQNLIRDLIKSGDLPHRRLGRWIIFVHKDDLMPRRIASRAEILG